MPVDIEGQETMFKELDMDKPKEKAIFQAALRFAKAKRERDEILSTAKEKADSAQEKLIALLHEAGITKFVHDGIKVEMLSTREKVQVREVGEEVQDDEEGEE